MAKNGFFKELTTGLPPWAKGIATLAILGGVAYGIYKIASGAKGLPEAIKEKKEEEELKNAGVKPSYTFTQYRAMADRFDAWARDTYNPFDMGNEDALWWLAKSIKNDLDFIEIEKAFGERRPSFQFSGVPLIQFITAMYDSDEIEEANKILTQNKVKRKF